jgi:hypothetical protein
MLAPVGMIAVGNPKAKKTFPILSNRIEKELFPDVKP